MILKVFLFIYQTMRSMIIILGAPTLESASISNRDTLGDNILPRILTHSNITSKGPLAAFSEDTFTDSRDIIFPDKFNLITKPNLEVDGTFGCTTTDANFCEEFKTYPLGYINSVLERTNKHSQFFGTDETPIEIANRLGEPEETFICPSTTKTIFPKLGKNKDDKWKFIINQGDEEGLHVQGIRIETCSKLNSPCNLLSNSPIGYVTTCKQKFVSRRLLSVAENGDPAPDTFQMPSACCCSFKKDISFLMEVESTSTSSKRRKRLK